MEYSDEDLEDLKRVTTDPETSSSEFDEALRRIKMLEG